MTFIFIHLSNCISFIFTIIIIIIRIIFNKIIFVVVILNFNLSMWLLIIIKISLFGHIYIFRFSYMLFFLFFNSKICPLCFEFSECVTSFFFFFCSLFFEQYMKNRI